VDKLGVLPHRGRSGVATHGVEVLLTGEFVELLIFDVYFVILQRRRFDGLSFKTVGENV
jgi:hypothetical protein